MNGKFRLGIVGTGLIARSSHIPAALASPSIELAALIDTERGRAEEVASDLEITPVIAREVREVIGKVDGVIIATPNHTHCPLAMECLEAGIPTLVEKPLATSVTDGERIVQVGEERGLVVAVGYTTRFWPSVAFMGELLAEGYFGRPLGFAYQYGTRGGWSALSGYALDRKAAGGGVLVVTGTHFLDRMLHWFGVPDEVALEDDSLGGPEANAVAWFRYHASETTWEGTARFSKTVDLPAGFVLETTLGTVLMRDRLDGQPVFCRHGEPDLETIVRRRGREATAGNPFRLQLEDFARACREGTRPMVSGREGLQSLRLIEALYANRGPMREDWYDASGGHPA